MTGKYRKEEHGILVWYTLISAVVVIAVYALGSYPFYIHQKSSVIRNLYKELQGMELNDLNDDEQEAISEYQEEKYELLIVDQKYKILYSSRNTI